LIVNIQENYNQLNRKREFLEEIMTYGVVDLFCGVGGLTCGLEKAGLSLLSHLYRRLEDADVKEKE